MLVKIPKGWEIPDKLVTPEELVMNRRHLLRSAGALALAGALMGCDKGTEPNSLAASGQGAAGASDPTASLYPFKRSAEYSDAGEEQDVLAVPEAVLSDRR